MRAGGAVSCLTARPLAPTESKEDIEESFRNKEVGAHVKRGGRKGDGGGGSGGGGGGSGGAASSAATSSGGASRDAPKRRDPASGGGGGGDGKAHHRRAHTKEEVCASQARARAVCVCVCGGSGGGGGGSGVELLRVIKVLQNRAARNRLNKRKTVHRAARNRVNKRKTVHRATPRRALRTVSEKIAYTDSVRACVGSAAAAVVVVTTVGACDNRRRAALTGLARRRANHALAHGVATPARATRVATHRPRGSSGARDTSAPAHLRAYDDRCAGVGGRRSLRLPTMTARRARSYAKFLRDVRGDDEMADRVLVRDTHTHTHTHTHLSLIHI